MVARRDAEATLDQLCELCGRPTWDGGVRVVVPDSAFVHPTDPSQDGSRLVAELAGLTRAELRGALRWRIGRQRRFAAQTAGLPTR